MSYYDINIDRLRRDLMNYYGAAMSVFPVAMMDLIDVENASEEELLRIAIRNGFNLEDYEEKVCKKYYK